MAQIKRGKYGDFYLFLSRVAPNRNFCQFPLFLSGDVSFIVFSLRETASPPNIASPALLNTINKIERKIQ